MNDPIYISNKSFQAAWANAILELKANRWKAWNLVVHIQNPEAFYEAYNSLLDNFARNNRLITPKQVEHTIFPSQLYSRYHEKNQLYRAYWKYFNLTRSMEHRGWGTYFERMIRYDTTEGDIDQLGSIIENIKSRTRNYGAAHTIQIPYPHRDLNKLMGAPCLNYITIQVEIEENRKIVHMLAVYRNHDFTERAYGNYMGLCRLLNYIAIESQSCLGTLTCISSHAYVPNKKNKLTDIANKILESGHE